MKKRHRKKRFKAVVRNLFKRLAEIQPGDEDMEHLVAAQEAFDDFWERETAPLRGLLEEIHENSRDEDAVLTGSAQDEVFALARIQHKGDES
jgi:hypothetical protein